MAIAEQAKLTSKGQVTIPKKIRDFLDLETGSVLVWKVQSGVVTVTKWDGSEEIDDDGWPQNRDEMLALMRQLRQQQKITACPTPETARNHGE